MRLGSAWAALLAVSTIVSGCGPGAAVPSSPGGGSPSPSLPSPTPTANLPAVWLPDWADARVPAAVVNRRPLPFCGVEEAPAPRPGEFIAATVRACFWAAKLEGREAEFASVQPTMEGAKIATIYRLFHDGSVELYYDATQDPFGGGGWSLTECTGVGPEEGDRLFGATGCGDAVPLQ